MEIYPKTAKEIREFIGSNFDYSNYANADQTPSDDDKYTLTAHDLLQAFEQWQEDLENSNQVNMDTKATKQPRKHAELAIEYSEPPVELTPMCELAGVEFPMPVQKPLQNGKEYWIPCVDRPHEPFRGAWGEGNCDMEWLEQNIISLTRKGAIKHGLALATASKKAIAKAKEKQNENQSSIKYKTRLPNRIHGRRIGT